MEFDQGDIEYRIVFVGDSKQKWERFEQKEEFHPALNQLMYTLRTNPRSFKLAQPLPYWRVAKTETYTWNNVIVPRIFVYFRLIEDDKLVEIVDVVTLSDLIKPS